MAKGTVVEIKKPEGIRDLLTETIREGARQLLAIAVRAEVDDYLACNNETEKKNPFFCHQKRPETQKK